MTVAVRPDEQPAIPQRSILPFPCKDGDIAAVGLKEVRRMPTAHSRFPPPVQSIYGHRDGMHGLQPLTGNGTVIARRR